MDVHISASICKWLNQTFDVEAVSSYKLDFFIETDYSIFMKAKKANAIFITKDKDYIKLLNQLKAPPAIIFLGVGNISNADLKTKLYSSFQQSIDLITKSGFDLVEII
ncbi:MAG: DUF5615 family PIN-like protein [Flavipsychrobacter sp.]|nr:DUF5615 family PIN-like protein [Flavipsychrobacter sp.]